MANLKWSWMFSDEDDATMALLGWTKPALGGNRVTTYLYSYPGDPMQAAGLRTSAGAYIGYGWKGPAAVTPTSGSISVPVYFSASPGTDDCVYIQKNATSTRISIKLTGPSSLGLHINGVLKEEITGLSLQSAWTYFTIKYDMSTNPWSAQMFINASGSGTTYTEALAAATSADFYLEGAATATNTFFGQVALYSDWANTEQMRYVTRVNPTVDTSEVGTWTPSTGTDNFAVISGSFSTAQYCQNTASVSSDNIVCRVTGALGLITQLGMSPPSIDGVTVHCWASGSGQNAVAGVSDNNSTWTTGSAITPSSSPTYGYVTVSSQPSDSAVWNATSSLYIKYEVV